MHIAKPRFAAPVVLLAVTECGVARARGRAAPRSPTGVEASVRKTWDAVKALLVVFRVADGHFVAHVAGEMKRVAASGGRRRRRDMRTQSRARRSGQGSRTMAAVADPLAYSE
jgi:hypothetical protein